MKASASSAPPGRPGRGILLAGGSALCIAAIYIITNLSQQTMAMELQLFWWFVSAVFWASFYYWKPGRAAAHRAVVRRQPGFFAVFLAIEVTVTVLFFYLIRHVNPAVVSFFDNLTPIFAAGAGFLLLKERLGTREIVGGALSVAGAGAITYASPEVSPLLLVLMVLNIGLYGLNSLWVRRHRDRVPAVAVTFVRLYFLAAIFAVNLAVSGGFRWPTPGEALLVAVGGLVGPVLGVLAFYASLHHITATQSFLIKNTQPFLVVVAATLLLHKPFTPRQLLGGLVIVVGLVVFSSRRRGKTAPAS